MTPNDAKACIAHLHTLYPKAAVHWPAARQQALRDQIGPMRITVDQFRACANDTAMNAKGSWCPPEAELIRRLRALVSDRGHERRIEQTRHTIERQPGDKTFAEWSLEYRANPRLRENLNPSVVRMLMSGADLTTAITRRAPK